MDALNTTLDRFISHFSNSAYLSLYSVFSLAITILNQSGRPKLPSEVSWLKMILSLLCDLDRFSHQVLQFAYPCWVERENKYRFFKKN